MAGGFGTRLKDKLKNIPKPMIPVNGRPFLDYVFELLKKNGINTVILSLYYKSNVIVQHYGDYFDDVKIKYSIDNAPLGTGGAIKKALTKVKTENVYIINGDTFFNINLKDLMNNQINNNNDITLSLKTMTDFDRYGFVNIQNNGRVIAFEEKKYQEIGHIDGGIYVIKKMLFKNRKTKNNFLFTDFINKNLGLLKIGSIIFDNEFIDIGTPEDLLSAPALLKTTFN